MKLLHTHTLSLSLSARFCVHFNLRTSCKHNEGRLVFKYNMVFKKEGNKLKLHSIKLKILARCVKIEMANNNNNNNNNNSNNRLTYTHD